MIVTENLSLVSDLVLKKKLQNTYFMIRKYKKDKKAKTKLEIEYCYLFRELEIRQQRKSLHENWLKNPKKKVG